ncbi:hypothetical protein ACHWQZ_G001758 [Mnemiopsis leidyi]
MAIENRAEKIKRVIGKLLREADPVSKQVLTVYDCSKNASWNSAKLSKLNRADLETLATYLRIPLISKNTGKKLYSNRETLAARIVKEIRSLYPSLCSECTMEYTVMPGSQPFHRCWMCLRGAHDCEEFTAKMELFLASPSQPNGLVWLCSDCISEHKSPTENDQPQSGRATPGIATPVRATSGKGTPVPGNDAQKENTAPPSTVAEPVTNGSNENAVNFSDPKEIVADKLNKELEKAKDEQKRSESKPNTCKHVCPRFQGGVCPHGISGKKAANGKEKCNLFHPKRCFRFMRNYTHETRGCREGDNCNYLHVNLCQSSIQSKKCSDVNCTEMHLVGTKRPKTMLKRNSDDRANKAAKSRKESESNQQSTKKKSGKKGSNKTQKIKTATDKVSFLGMKSLLDEVKTTVLGEIQALKEEMDLYKQQLQLLTKEKEAPAPIAECTVPPYGLFKPTPCGVPQQQLIQRVPENYPIQAHGLPMFHQANMTPIRPAYF